MKLLNRSFLNQFGWEWAHAFWRDNDPILTPTGYFAIGYQIQGRQRFLNVPPGPKDRYKMVASETPKPMPAGKHEQSQDAETIHLLLVDDEEAYVNVLANRLRKRGFIVTKSYSGTDALQQMRRNEFDVAVLDLKMADMDGIEVLRIVKLIDPQIQVIMLTGHGSATACKQGIDLGAFDYLTKPCELDDLVQKIRAAFTAKRNASRKQ